MHGELDVSKGRVHVGRKQKVVANLISEKSSFKLMAL